MEIDSVGVELNERLRAAAALREAGNATTVMDEEWEQWLKDEAEAGGIPSLADYILPASDSSNPRNVSSTSVPPRLLNAARLGQWHQIPEFLQDMVRQNIEAHNSRNGYGPSTEQTSQRRENPVPITGRTALRSISTTAPSTFSNGTQQIQLLQYAACHTIPRHRQVACAPSRNLGNNDSSKRIVIEVNIAEVCTCKCKKILSFFTSRTGSRYHCFTGAFS